MPHQLLLVSTSLKRQRQATSRQRLLYCGNSSGRGIHFSRSRGVCRASSCCGVRSSSASGNLRRASACSVRCLSSCHYISPAPTGYAAPVGYIGSHLQCTLHLLLLNTSHQHRRGLQLFHRCTRGSSSLAFTLRFERHAGVHFHARVSTLASMCLWAAVPPMPADRCMEQNMEAELRTTL